MQEKHKVFLLFCLWCVLCLFAIAELSPQSYRILEPELSRLETIWQDSQADKLTWLSQVQKLKTEAVKLQAASVTLNKQLSTQREQTERLRKSFEQLESDRLKQATDYETRIAVLKEEKSALEISLQKVKNTRNLYGMILLSLAGIALVSVFWKFRKLFGFPI